MAARVAKKKSKQPVTPKPKRPDGRPPHVPTEALRHTVMVMKVSGESDEMIAKCIGDGGIALNTLYKYYAAELETGRTKLLTAVAGSAFRRALAGDNEMTKLILRTRGGWVERNALEHTGKDGGPIKTEDVGSPALMIRDMLDRLRSAHAPKDEAGG